MLCRCILPPWKADENPNARRVLEGDFSSDQLKHFNETDSYGIFYLPNGPSNYQPGVTIDGSHIDIFRYVYVDFDLKGGTYPDKDSFLVALGAFPLTPSRIVDSGNGIHAYWAISDLDAMSFLRLNRRLCRLLKTDEAVAKIYQLMRVPGTINTKDPLVDKPCEEIYSSDASYTCEEMDGVLPPLSHDDERYCQDHYAKTYNTERRNLHVDAKVPEKFKLLLHRVPKVKDIWEGNVEDRSRADFELGHILWSEQYTKDEARSVLVNCAKAVTRAPVHRIAYADNIIEKVWKAEEIKQPVFEELSQTVGEILQSQGDGLKGTRFACDRVLDATQHGFRLGQVIGLVAGSGVGKTAMALNMFRWFVKNNPNHHHFFVPLEQPAREIADRWKTMCVGEEHLYDKVHIMSNYAENGTYRRLSLKDIEDYLILFQQKTGKKVGCVVIDHIGVLKKPGKTGEKEDIGSICQDMKAFAQRTETMLVMQSQTSREKAGIGDLELNKDAAYGTSDFENYCDYLVTIWQPLKRCYAEEGCPTVTAYKFCKIRHKKKGFDDIQEDVPYRLYFDPASEHMRPMTQKEEEKFRFWNSKATKLRKADRKTDVLEYASTSWLDQDQKGA